MTLTRRYQVSRNGNNFLYDILGKSSFTYFTTRILFQLDYSLRQTLLNQTINLVSLDLLKSKCLSMFALSLSVINVNL